MNLAASNGITTGIYAVTSSGSYDINATARNGINATANTIS